MQYRFFLNILLPLGLTAADARIQKKDSWFGSTTLIISNEKMNDIIKIVIIALRLFFYSKVPLTQLKMKQNNKKEDFLVC